MIIYVRDVAEHFSCDYATATKITNFLLKASDVCMAVEDIVDFSFCGVRYSLLRTATDWVLIRSTTARAENIDDVLK